MGTAESSIPRPGQVLAGRYVLREQVGQGGMGTVFLADQPALARTVAIKILHPWLAGDREIATRFREEAVAASRVRHPGSVAVIDCQLLEDGTPFIVMEQLKGRSLGRLIAEEELPLLRVLDLVLQIARAVAAAHAGGVVHADVKSDNFLVDTVDGRDHVTLIDFGLACLDGKFEHPEDGYVAGTPEYMAPEVIRGGAPGEGTDQYGIGVILYELLTGTTPFSGGRTTEIMERHIEDLAIPPSLRHPARMIPSALDQIVLRALEKRPEDRFGDVDELVEALAVVARGLDPVAQRPTRNLEAPADAAGPSSTTRTWSTPPLRERLARGSSSGPARGAEADALRRAIGRALATGDVERIAEGYEALAAALVRHHRVAEAVRELEEALDVVTVGRGTADLGRTPQADHIAASLAALHAQLGHRDLATGIAGKLGRHATPDVVRRAKR